MSEREFIVSFAIEGSATIVIAAESDEEAIQKVKDGDWPHEPEIETWDMNTKSDKGGYIEAVPND